MTRSQFFAICAHYLIDPSDALESGDIVEALRDNDADAVIDILENDFFDF